SAQDHKRVFDGDEGPNTGGMGCSTPPLVLTEDLKRQTLEIISKAVTALKKESRPYKGILYLGGIVVDEKVFVIEFNSRWGDPEVQCVLPGFKTDLFELNMKAYEGRIEDIEVEMDDKARVVVAGASKGYPGDYSQVKGKQIYGIEDVLKLPGIKFYSAGIKRVEGKYTASGGRLFYIAGQGKDVIEARKNAYEAIKLISVEGDNLHYRTDIGYRDVERLKSG
ncbi:phosphoribosylamine--glycine ligase, partial [Candidatus Daviesbacteria bacterium]|nr:phosphoribosylamine--glycine ligase [Candidatus Daviesbacteria bacterium]